MDIIRLLFINNMIKLAALLLRKCPFLGHGVARWFAVLFSGCIMAVILFSYFPLTENILLYILIFLGISGIFKVIDIYRIYVLDIPELQLEGVELPADDEEKDFPYPQYKDKHWWSFLYWTGWFTLVFGNLMILLGIVLWNEGEDKISSGFSILIFTFFDYVIIRDALRRKQRFKARHPQA